MKKKRLSPLRPRRGITITEVTIALVIISIISAAALSVVMYSVNVEKQAFSVINAKTAAENTLACFRYAETQEEFAQALEKTGAYEQQPDGSWVLSDNGCTVTVKADFTQRYFEYSAVNADGEQIYAFRYPRETVEGGVS